jgi:hypothetical protein
MIFTDNEVSLHEIFHEIGFTSDKEHTTYNTHILFADNNDDFTLFNDNDFTPSINDALESPLNSVHSVNGSPQETLPSLTNKPGTSTEFSRELDTELERMRQEREEEIRERIQEAKEIVKEQSVDSGISKELV